MKYLIRQAGARHGKLPHEFDAAPLWSQKEALAFTRAEKLVEGYLMPEPEDESRDKKGKRR